MARLKNPVLKWATRPYAEAEGGLHTDIFRAAILMLEAGHDDVTTFAFLRSACNVVLDRPVPDREIQSAIRYAIARMGGDRISQKWPKFSPEYRNEIIAKHGNLLPALAEQASLISQDPKFYVQRLFAQTDLVCVAMSASSFLTLPRDTIALADNLPDVEYVTPNAMSAPTGKTEMGDESAHCLANTGPKIRQVVEFDFGQPHEHAAILWHLASKLPLILCVYSGGKSIHGWFNVRDVPEQVVIDFFAEAVLLGADPKMWSKCQFSRLPAGTNQKSHRQQTVIFFNHLHL